MANIAMFSPFFRLAREEYFKNVNISQSGRQKCMKDSIMAGEVIVIIGVIY
jgi:hypothetical protein